MPQPPDKSRILAQANPYFVDPSGYPNSSSAGLAAAVAALPTGGILELGPGNIWIDEPWVIDKVISVRGAGAGHAPSNSTTRILFKGHTAIVANARVEFSDFALVHAENTNTGLPTNAVPDGVPMRQWRPSRSVVVGTHLVGVRCPWRKADIDAGRPWNWGVSFYCIEANGSTAIGASGTTGATEPSWPNGSPKIGQGDVYTFTANAGTDVVTATGHPYSDGQRVRVYTPDGSLPAPLAINTTYFVRDVSGATFKLAATSGGAAIDLTTAGSGTLQVFKQAFSTDQISDGNVKWIPVLVHGVEVRGRCDFKNVLFERIPGNDINIDASTLYATVPHTIDPRLGLNYSSASLGSITRCSFANGGGSAIFLNGYDSSVWATYNNDIREHHGYGIFDNSSFGGVHIANHIDGCEEGYLWGRTGAWFGNYNEAQYGTFGCPVMKLGAKWYSGTWDKFSGVMTPAPTTITRGMAAVSGQAYKLSVDNGLHYLCVESGTTHATIEPEYPTGISWYLSPTEQGISFASDTYQLVTDGTAKFRPWASSEVSNAEIANASFDQVFTSRYSGMRFWAAGDSGTQSAFGYAANSTLDNGGTRYDMIYDDTAKHWRFQRGGSIDVFRIGAHGSTNGLAVGAIGFPNGVYVGGVSPFLRVVYGTAAPTSGAWVRGERVLDANASAGGTEGWVCVASGTPGTWKTFGAIAA